MIRQIQIFNNEFKRLVKKDKINNDIMVIDKYCKNKIIIWIKLDCLIDKPCILNRVIFFWLCKNN